MDVNGIATEAALAQPAHYLDVPPSSLSDLTVGQAAKAKPPEDLG